MVTGSQLKDIPVVSDHPKGPGDFLHSRACTRDFRSRPLQTFTLGVPVSGSISPHFNEIIGLEKNGAQERTRTFTAVKPLAPEASASTNSATWALGAVTTDRSRACQIGDRRPKYTTKYTTMQDMTARRESAKQPHESLEFG
jgi:hypothetical protein